MANILIADDEKEIVRLLRMYIEANDNIVFEANDGQEALQILDRENIDLAIVDIMMPKKNGYEIIKSIRKGPYIPIHMLYSCIAHDLKTPMTSVQGFAAALKEGKVKPEEQAEVYEIIYNKSCYMNELLDTMFVFSRLNTDDYTLSLRNLDVCALVRELAALHYDEFEARAMNLDIDIPEEAVKCNVDEKEMKRAISNLLVNVYKHNSNGAGILVRVTLQGDMVRIIVADNGEAIGKEVADEIFEPFAKGDSARSDGKGTGLGLAISGLVVSKHSGRLYIDDSIEGYTKGFVICLKRG